MPRTLAQNAQYIAETIKPAIKSAIEAQGVTVPSTDSFLDYADRIAEIEGGGSGYQLKDLPSGSISTVNDAAELPLNALKVSVEAWQEGSGDPSPSNIRPIHGWDSGEISVVGKNWLPMTIDGIKAANTAGTWNGDTYTVTGVSFTIESDNDGNVTGIKANGTASGGISILTIMPNTSNIYNGMILNGGFSSTCRIQMYNQSALAQINAVGADVPINFANNDTCRISIIINSAATADNVMIYPMIRLSTETDSTFEPYQGNTTTLDFPTTIYGAEWDVINGELGLKITDGFDVFDGSEAWEQDAVNYYSLKVYLPTAWASDVWGQSNEYKYNGATSGHSGMSQEGMYWWYNSLLPDPNYRYLMIRDDNQNSLADFKQFLAQNPLQVRYKLATPTYVTLTGLSIRLLEGTNNVYADCGEVIEGEYFVDEGAIDVRKVDYQIGSSGSIKTTDGRVLSGFASMSGYHSRPLDASGNWLDVDWSKDFEIGVAFKALSFSERNITIFGSGVSGSMNYAPNLYFYQGSTAYITLSENGSSSAVDTALNYTFQTDTWYFVRVKFTKSTLNLKIEVSTDMSNFTTAYDDTLAAAPYHDAASIGIGGMTQNVNYSSNNLLIDTFNTYIKGDGVNWGASTGAFPR